MERLLNAFEINANLLCVNVAILKQINDAQMQM